MALPLKEGKDWGNNNHEIETRNKNKIKIETNNGITDSFVEKLNEGRNKDKETEVGI